MRHLHTVALLGVAVAAQPAYGQKNQAAEIVAVIQACSANVPAAQSVTALKSSGWKDITPVMFGRSMAEVTGGTQLQRKSDQALVNAAGGAAGRNCQFDFSLNNSVTAAQIETALTEVLGTPPLDNAGKTWARGGNRYSLVQRSAGKVTILWLPEQSQKAAN